MDEYKYCNYCKRPLKEGDAFCPFCGYDPKTDAINPAFKQKVASIKDWDRKIQMEEIGRGHGISPGVKMFAFIGLAVVIFSIFYKYNFNPSGVMSEVNQVWAKARIKASKFIPMKAEKKKEKAEEKKIEKTELIDVRSFEGAKKTTGGLVVEGIFFDPKGKSFVTINGKVVSEGETFGNITVKKINVNSVELIIESETKIIEVKQ